MASFFFGHLLFFEGFIKCPVIFSVFYHGLHFGGVLAHVARVSAHRLAPFGPLDQPPNGTPRHFHELPPNAPRHDPIDCCHIHPEPKDIERVSWGPLQPTHRSFQNLSVEQKGPNIVLGPRPWQDESCSLINHGSMFQRDSLKWELASTNHIQFNLPLETEFRLFMRATKSQYAIVSAYTPPAIASRGRHPTTAAKVSQRQVLV